MYFQGMLGLVRYKWSTL